MQWIGGAESLDAIADGGWHPQQQEFTASQKQSSEVLGGSVNGGGEQQALGRLAVGHALVTDESMDFSAIDDDDHEKAAGKDAEKQAQTQTQTLQSGGREEGIVPEANSKISGQGSSDCSESRCDTCRRAWYEGGESRRRLA